MLSSIQWLFITARTKYKLFSEPRTVLYLLGRHSLSYFFLPFSIPSTLYFIFSDISVHLNFYPHPSGLCIAFFLSWIFPTHHYTVSLDKLSVPSTSQINLLSEAFLHIVELVSRVFFTPLQQLLFHLHNTCHILLHFSIFAFLSPISLSAPLGQE